MLAGIFSTALCLLSQLAAPRRACMLQASLPLFLQQPVERSSTAARHVGLIHSKVDMPQLLLVLTAAYSLRMTNLQDGPAASCGQWAAHLRRSAAECGLSAAHNA